MKIKKKQINNFIKYLSVPILIVVLLICSYFLFFNKKSEISSDEVIRRAGKIVVLPSDEIPTVATITDLIPLKDSLFFKDAKLGDKVIIYAKSGKAVIFRIGENKIVEIGPLNFNLSK